MISRAQENEGANTVDLKTNLRSSSLLQLRLLDRDHVIRLLLTPFGICHINLTLLFLCLEEAEDYSILSSFHLFLPFHFLLPFLLLFLFLPFGVANIQPDRQGGADGHDEIVPASFPQNFRAKSACYPSEHAGRPCTAQIAT